MSTHGIRTLNVKVVGCCKLEYTNWMGKLRPFVCLDYGGTKFKTKRCKGNATDSTRGIGIGEDPYFREEFEFTLIEGLPELNVTVWDYHKYGNYNDFIGSARVKLDIVLSTGTDNRSWALQREDLSAAGEVQLTMHYSNTNAQANPPQPTPPHHYPSPGDRQPQPYSTPPPQQAYHAPQGSFYHNVFQRPTY